VHEHVEPGTAPGTQDGIRLDEVEQRVLGALLEKQRTVPGSYPLSQNALRTACNQTSSRDPVVDYDDRTVLDAVARLKDRGLVRTVWTGAGSRVLKYHQLLDAELEVDEGERALLTVLLLRGAQTAGELRTRCERLHAFADKQDAERALEALAARTEPLVRELPRAGGHKDTRWVHLLGPVPSAAAAAAEPVVDRDAVLADGVGVRDARVVAGYDHVAAAYADALAEELAHKPFDRWVLEQVAGVARRRPVVDAGCGPGHVAAHLAELGADVKGVDVSEGMLAEARERFPHVEFELGDLTRLLRPRTAPGWGAVLAWYSLVHLAGSELREAVASLARVLDDDGWLVIALHVGDEGVRHVDTLCGEAVDLDFVLHDREQVLDAVRAAGLVDVEWYLRGPYDVEAQTERLYVLARKED
jgi:uncharacterized protein YceH (UPF0502 family)